MNLGEKIDGTGQNEKPLTFTSVTDLVQYLSGKRGSDRWDSFCIALEETRYRGVTRAEPGRVVLGVAIRLAIKDSEGNKGTSGEAYLEVLRDFGYVEGSAVLDFKHNSQGKDYPPDWEVLFGAQSGLSVIEALQQLENMSNFFGFRREPSIINPPGDTSSANMVKQIKIAIAASAETIMAAYVDRYTPLQPASN